MTQSSLHTGGRAYVGIRNSSGYLTGGLAAAAAGAESQMHRIRGSLDLPFTFNPLTFLPIFDDIGLTGTVVTESDAALSRDFSTNNVDDSLINLIQQTTADATNYGTASLTIVDPGDLTPLDLCMIVNVPAKVVGVGTNKWATLVSPLIQMAFTGMNVTRGGSNYAHNYSYGVSKVATLPWGLALSEVTNGATSAGGLILTGDYPISVTAALGDNATVQFDLAQTPFEESGDGVQVWLDGVLQTYTTNYTVDAANKQVNFVAAPGTSVQIQMVNHHLETEW